MLELHPIVKAKVYRCDYRDCKYNDCGQCSKKEVEVILYNDNKSRCGSFEPFVRFSKIEFKYGENNSSEWMEHWEGKKGIVIQRLKSEEDWVMFLIDEGRAKTITTFKSKEEAIEQIKKKYGYLGVVCDEGEGEADISSCL